MKIPLRILHLEDDKCDIELIRITLRAENVASEIICVQTRHEFEAAIMIGRFDLIISDSSLPGFEGHEALKMASIRHPETPFIFVCGAIGRERTVELMTSGASGYVSKDELSGLVPAIRRALDGPELQ